MKYSMDEAMAELKRRSDAIRRRRSAMVGRGLTVLVVLLGASLVAALGTLNSATASSEPGGALGAFLLSGAAGGYILAGVIAFVTGIVATLICVCHTQRRGGVHPRDGTGQNTTWEQGSGSPNNTATEDKHQQNKEDMR